MRVERDYFRKQYEQAMVHVEEMREEMKEHEEQRRLMQKSIEMNQLKYVGNQQQNDEVHQAAVGTRSIEEAE